MSEQLFGMMGMGTDPQTLRGLPQGQPKPTHQPMQVPGAEGPIPTTLPTVEDDVEGLIRQRERMQGLAPR